MMETQEHLTENSRPKLFTRSAARHLRRKRLHEARKVEKQQKHLINGISAEFDQKSEVEKNSVQLKVITKSKARRLREKIKSKSINNECSLENMSDACESVKTTEISGDINHCSIEHEKVKNSGVESIEPSTKELFNNARNLEFDNSPELNTSQSVTDSIKLNSSKLEDNNSIFVTKEDITSANSVKKESETESDLYYCPILHNRACNLKINSSKTEVDIDATPVQNIDNTSSEPCSLPKNIEPDRPTIVQTKMTNNKEMASEKSREEIKAEREAKKAAKALAKAKAKTAKTQDKNVSDNKPAPSDSIKNKQSSETSKTLSKENVEPPHNTPTVNNTVKTCANAGSSEKSEAGSEKKSKTELRADRRAKQEAQRATKQQLLLEKNKVKTEEKNSSNIVTRTADESNAMKKINLPKRVRKGSKDTTHEINLFKHLYHERKQAIVIIPLVNSKVHPAIIRLGTQYASKVIAGSNARCVAFLAAVKQFIRDFERPSQADFIRGLDASLQECADYLHSCRPSAVSMQNALRHLKWQMTLLPDTLSDLEAKNKLNNVIDTYISEQIQLAGKAISITIQSKISKGDVILTYGCSSLIYKILLDAHTAGKQFRVIIVDGRPWLEGKEQLRRLVKHGIECSYILINALSYIMPQVSKVFLGAHAILANGAVMSRVGTAQVALMAKAFNIPVLVACETHKSCERVQTDSIVYNELGNADELVQDYGHAARKSPLVNWKNRKCLNLLNITYDVTPADLVTAVVTELAILPCTSVPVILRFKPSEM